MDLILQMQFSKVLGIRCCATVYLVVPSIKSCRRATSYPLPHEEIYCRINYHAVCGVLAGYYVCLDLCIK